MLPDAAHRAASPGDDERPAPPVGEPPAARRRPATATNADVVRRARWHLDGGVPADPALLHAAANIARLGDPHLSRRIAEANRRWNGGADALATLVEIHIEAADLAAAEQVLDVIRSEAATVEDLEMARPGRVRRHDVRPQGRGRGTCRRSRRRERRARWTSGSSPRWRCRPTCSRPTPSTSPRSPNGSRSRPMPARGRSCAAGLAATVGALLAGETRKALGLAETLTPVAAQHASLMPTMDGVFQRDIGIRIDLAGNRWSPPRRRSGDGAVAGPARPTRPGRAGHGHRVVRVAVARRDGRPGSW